MDINYVKGRKERNGARNLHKVLLIPQTVLALRGSHGVGIEGLWMVCGSAHGRARSFLLLFIVLDDTYPQKCTVKHSVASVDTEKYNTVDKCLGPGQFFGWNKNAGGTCGARHLSFKDKDTFSQHGA